MRRLICTIASSIYEPIRPVVYPMLERYARRVGADFAAIEDLKWKKNTVLDKFRIGDYLDDYDRLIYFDSDIVVRDDCPNLFDLVPEHMFGAYEESSTFSMYKEGKPFDYTPVRERVGCMLDLCIAWSLKIPIELLGDIENIRYFNMGMYVCSKKHQFLFKPQAGEFTNPVGVGMPEQCYMNWGIMTKKVPVYYLPACFDQMPHNFPLHYKDCSYVIHYAGYHPVKERFNRMKETLEYWEKVGFNGPGV